MTNHEHHSPAPKHEHGHAHEHGHHQHGSHGRRGVHKDWRLWAVVLLMLGAMAMYVMSDNEVFAPGGNGEPQPAAPAPAAP